MKAPRALAHSIRFAIHFCLQSQPCILYKNDRQPSLKCSIVLDFQVIIYMKIGYLGAGSWGFCLSLLLASKGYEIVSWTTRPKLADLLNEGLDHPLFPGYSSPKNIHFTTNLEAIFQHADLIVESITASAFRSVCEKMRAFSPKVPFVITSKGIEQNSGFILSDVAVDVLGESFRSFIGHLSGPSYAKEVIAGLPTSVVASAYDPSVMHTICHAFTTQTFRVYPNADIRGVAFGGALKNIIAIACGIADGLGYGHSSKAALVTRGLHEMSKLAIAKGCQPATLYGLSGLGDVYLTCSSPISRNFHFGQLLAQGISTELALNEINMVVEGAYTCVAALQLSKELHIPMPITEAIYKIIYEGLKAKDAVSLLMQRAIKEEHL